MKIAIASSGLGHISRGIETWALDTANALHRKGIDVTLFSAGEVESEAPLKTLSCIRRRSTPSNLIIKVAPPFTWRWGLKSGYALEQRSFWKHLKKELNKGNFDILHIQDPLIADLCRKARARGKTTTKEILAHGTEESPLFLSKFDYLQHLAPWHLEETVNILQAGKPTEDDATSSFPFWTAMPNFVDTTQYRPAQDTTEKMALREKFGIPADAFVIGTAAAIKKDHKRIDYLIREFAAFANHQKSHKQNGTYPPPALVIAGSHQPDTKELQKLATELCPKQIVFKINHPHAQMPELLRCLDAFVLTSLFEMMPIALLEAIATGVPVITHNHPVLKWMGDSGGIQIDMAQKENLAKTLTNQTIQNLQTLGKQARNHALKNFSEDAVIQQYIHYYNHISGND